MPTDYHAKLFAHQLRRRHSSADSEKLAAALMDAQVDLNPHQVEAALFAFKSPLSKGAVLADEVGLGKTIEAGLVLAQKWTEGKRRILVIGPANLRKQWAQEIEEKFYLPTLILEAANYNRLVKQGKRPFEQPGIIICSFQFAARHDEELMVTPWDLVVIDEAHRLRNVYRPDNKIGRALKNALTNAPKVLLTATPLQNSLMELYGLISLIDDYAFGDAKSFRSQYSRLTGEALYQELKARLAPICHRTLRRQVLEYIRFTNRIPITQEFTPTEKEQALYDMVSDYLRRPSLQALPSSQRTLMTLIMRKLLASSTFAIAGALDSLARKLERQLKDDRDLRDRFEAELAEDYEEMNEIADEWSEFEEEPGLLTEADIESIRREIEDLREFRDLAVSIAENAKGDALLKSLETGFAKAAELGARQKAIIFTESRRTQDYLERILTENGYGDDLVLFNGSNNDERSRRIYADWKDEYAGTDRISGSRTADIRAALVDHFKKRAKIMIATEAAAEGINLQFCSMVVNYDLPWNPQRIEQRIGRCHRYGQQHDVVVVNFLNKKNAADRRVFELLAEKFKLFSGVFGASDEVLGAIESGVEFEKRIVSIYQNCRTQDEIEAEFERLRTEMDERITTVMEDTRKKLLENFDADVHDRLKINLHKSREYINRYEQMLWLVTKHEIGDFAEFDDGYMTFTLRQAPYGLDVSTGGYYLTKNGMNGRRYRLGHKLAQYVLDRAARRELSGGHIVFDYGALPRKSVDVEPLVGMGGSLTARRLSVSGADAQDHILLATATREGVAVDPKTALRLFDLPVKNLIPGVAATPAAILKSLDEQHEKVLQDMADRKAQWFDQEMEKLDNWADDKRASLKRDLKDLDDRIKELKKEIRRTGNLPDKLEMQRKVRDLESKRTEAWRAYDEAAKSIEDQKDGLLDQVEEHLRQEIETEDLFTITFEVV